METQTIRQMIMSGARVREIIAEGSALPGCISGTHRDLSVAEKILTDFEVNGLRQAKIDIDAKKGEVAYEVSVNPEFKNEGQRKAAIDKCLAENGAYQNMLTNLRSLEVRKADLAQKVTLAKIEYEHARNQFTAWQCEMAVIAGLSNENAARVVVEHRMEVSSHVDKETK